MEDKKKILLFCSADHALTHAVILSLAPLLPAIKEEFNFSYTLSFGFAALNIFIYGTGGIPAGYLSDRVGPFRTLLLGIFVVVLSCFALAFSFSPIQFMLFIFILGLGSSFYHPPGITAISNSYTEGRGKALGIHGLLGNLGQFGSPIFAGVVGALFGWRANYLIWGFAFVLLGIFLLYLILKGVDEKTQLLFTAKWGSDRSSSTINFFKLKKETLQLLLTPMVLSVLFLTIFRGWYYRGTLYIIPFYIEEIYNLTRNEATALGGTFITFALVAGGIGNYVGGHIKDRKGAFYPLLIFTLISLLSLLLIVFNPFTLGGASLTLFGKEYILVFNGFIFGIFLFGFGFFGCQAPLNAFIAELVTSEKRGRLFGITFFTRFGLSAIAMLMVGVAAEHSLSLAISLNLLFVVLALATVGIMIFYAKNTVNY